MPNPFTRQYTSEPARDCITIVPSDGADQAKPLTSIYVGGTGDITLTPLSGGTDVVFKAVPVGTILPVSCARIKATGTTATLMIGLV